MANLNHLKLLQQGIEAWNKWRVEPKYDGDHRSLFLESIKNPEYKKPDLSYWNGAFLRKVQFDKYVSAAVGVHCWCSEAH